MSNEFMIHVGMESHARLVSEWAHYKSWAEMQADKVESLGRQLDGLRRGLQRLVGAPDVPRLSDAELMIALGHALEKVDSGASGWVPGRVHYPDGSSRDVTIEEQPRGYVEYSRPAGPVELTVDVSALRGAPFGEPFGEGVRPAPVVPVPASPGMPVAAYEDFRVRAPGESPWLVPPQDGPATTHLNQRDPAEHDRAAGARCAEPVGDSVCGARVTDGRCPEHGDLSRSSTELDGPATESMPPVEEPPEVDPDYVLGRVFVRGDTIPDDTTTLPRLLVNRQGDEWSYSGSPDPGYPGTAAFYCEEMHAERSFDELLHMHGTLWELCNAAEQDSGQVSGE